MLYVLIQLFGEKIANRSLSQYINYVQSFALSIATTALLQSGSSLYFHQLKPEMVKCFDMIQWLRRFILITLIQIRRWDFWLFFYPCPLRFFENLTQKGKKVHADPQKRNIMASKLGVFRNISSFDSPEEVFSMFFGGFFSNYISNTFSWIKSLYYKAL